MLNPDKDGGLIPCRRNVSIYLLKATHLVLLKMFAILQLELTFISKLARSKDGVRHPPHIGDYRYGI